MRFAPAVPVSYPSPVLPCPSLGDDWDEIHRVLELHIETTHPQKYEFINIYVFGTT